MSETTWWILLALCYVLWSVRIVRVDMTDAEIGRAILEELEKGGNDAES